MGSQFTISLIWVPGHRDIVGNCIADELARQGTIVPLLPGKENVSMPMATCKLNIKNYSKKLANIHWQNPPHQTWPLISNKKNLGITKIQPHRVWHADLSSYRLLARQHTCRQGEWGRRGNGRNPSLLLPSHMKTQTETLRKPLHRRSFRNIGDLSQRSCGITMDPQRSKCFGP